jgi:hypothetical protein
MLYLHKNTNIKNRQFHIVADKDGRQKIGNTLRNLRKYWFENLFGKRRRQFTLDMHYIVDARRQVWFWEHEFGAFFLVHQPSQLRQSSQQKIFIAKTDYFIERIIGIKNLGEGIDWLSKLYFICGQGDLERKKDGTILKYNERNEYLAKVAKHEKMTAERRQQWKMKDIVPFIDRLMGIQKNRK